MRSIGASLLAVALLGGGCGKSESVQATDVVTVAACPDGGACELVADGVSLIAVEACVPAAVTPLAPGLTVTLRASAGTWDNPPDKTQPGVYTASLSANRCVRPTLIAPANVLSVLIDAQLVGYTSSTVIDLAPASLRTIELTAQPTFIGPDTSQILIRAVVRAEGLGNATAGTVVSFDTNATPDSAFAAAWPQSSVIDQNFSVQTTVVVGSHVTALTVTATAIGPTSPGSPAASPVTSAITIAAQLPDGGTTDGP
jgi:hypothetical protein